MNSTPYSRRSKMAASLTRAAASVARNYGRTCRSLRSLATAPGSHQSDPGREAAKVTHTGQKWDENDYRAVRFTGKQKLVNKKYAIDMIAEDPVVVCTQHVVSSDSGGALGHPKVYINVDKPGVHSCGYSGRKFVHKKYYDKATMGPCITYEEYLKDIKAGDREYQNFP